MSEQTINILKDIPMEFWSISIYDMRIEGIRTLEEAEEFARLCVEKVKNLGYTVVERNGYYFVEVE